MKQEIVICGIEILSDALFSKIIQKYSPVCFIDHKGTAGSKELYGIPVLSFEEAIAAHGDSTILLLVSHYEKHSTIDWLLENGVSVRQIIGVQGKAEERWGCAYLGEYVTFWNGELRHCCSLANTYHLPIRSSYRNTGMETYQAFTSDTRTLIQRIQNDAFRKKYCGTCGLLRYGKWVSGEKLDKINIGIESGCNYKCVYCGEGGGPYGGMALDDGSSIDAALEMIKYCRNNHLLDEFAYFFISCGEPALHPRIHDIVDLVGEYRCTFATNASVYSEPIASVLKNGMSRLRVSIDAGTPETYEEIRGVPAKFYKRVHDNLRRYAQIDKRCVELQYIVIPGVNMDKKNIEGFCYFAQDICESVLISRDRNHVEEIDADTAQAVVYLRKELEESGIRARVFDEAVCAFTKEEHALMEKAENACQKT